MAIRALETQYMAAAAIVLAAACATTPFVAGSAFAQGANPTYSNVIPASNAVTMQARIRAIDRKSRAVTLAGRSGTKVTAVAGPAVRLHLLKVGDTVNVQYYRSVAFAISGPGMAVPNDQISGMIARPAQAPGGIGAQVVKVSGLIVGINMASHSVDLVDPSGGAVLTVNVVDPARQAALARVKVGDTVTAVVSEALAVSITPAPKSFF